MSDVETVAGGDALTNLAREVLEESDESAYAYLAQGWLSSAIEKLYDARRAANLTQKEVAERLGTKQPAIARLEKDDGGRVSLHRYIEYALACDMLPLDIMLKPAEDVRRYATYDPEAPRSEKAYEAWRNGIVHGSSDVIPTVRYGASLSWTVADPESVLAMYQRGQSILKAAGMVPGRKLEKDPKVEQELVGNAA